MILLLDTSTPLCKLSLIDDGQRFDDEWQAGRTLAKGLMAYIDLNLKKHDKTWSDIDGVGVFKGPGSFTGLRIGLTVANTIAGSQLIPIVGGMGEKWQDEVTNKLQAGQNEEVVMPFYGSEAHITSPRK